MTTTTKKEKAMFRIDMHVHTRGSDGVSTAEQIAQSALAADLDGLCITDHHHTYTPEGLAVAAACRAVGLRVFFGCEYSAAEGHILVYGADVDQLDLGQYPPMQDVIDKVRAAGGVAIPAHPWHGYTKGAIGAGLKKLRYVVAIEGVNGQLAVRTPAKNHAATTWANANGVQMIGGSDAHHASYVGVCFTEFEVPPQTDEDLVDALKWNAARACVNLGRKAVARVVWTTPMFKTWIKQEQARAADQMDQAEAERRAYAKQLALRFRTDRQAAMDKAAQE